MSENQYRILSLLMTGLLLAGSFFLGRETAQFVQGNTVQNRQRCIVLDAGHGGNDPGKVGINGVEEKQLNLEIALRVKKYLEASDVQVVLTRDSDDGLHDADAPNKKVQDMRRRVELIESTAPDAVISIHQNSYPQEAIHGAQVFYFSKSKASQHLADKIQTGIRTFVDTENKRETKPNDSYYLLKKTSCPIVIVECGFLSNAKEAKLLCESAYQDRIAWTIALGINQYLNTMK